MCMTVMIAVCVRVLGLRDKEVELAGYNCKMELTGRKNRRTLFGEHDPLSVVSPNDVFVH